MKVAVARESFPGERRVALIPSSVAGLVKAGLEVLVESSAGARAGFTDSQYAEAGATVVDNRPDIFAADVVLQVRAAGANPDAGRADLDLMHEGQVIIGICDPLGDPEAAQDVAIAGATLFSLEMLPRITRAQSMDVLSSMATVAGYQAVLLAAVKLPKMFPMLMTAAGTIRPAKVFIMGVGVAGLQAIATARRLGAVVSANDIRPAVKEQVESLGAKFVQIDLETVGAEDKGGYANQMSDEFLAKQRELIAQVIAESDVVITTAAVPGKKAPTLVTAEMVASMAPGSVIVDLAAERGGNCELTVPGETIESGGVSILGPNNLPSEVPYHASQMFAKNITTFLGQLIRNGELNIDTDDEIIRETLITRDRNVVNPKVCELLGIEPPPPEVEEDTPNDDQKKPVGDDEYKIADGGDQ